MGEIKRRLFMKKALVILSILVSLIFCYCNQSESETSDVTDKISNIDEVQDRPLIKLLDFKLGEPGLLQTFDGRQLFLKYNLDPERKSLRMKDKIIVDIVYEKNFDIYSIEFSINARTMNLTGIEFSMYASRLFFNSDEKESAEQFVQRIKTVHSLPEPVQDGIWWKWEFKEWNFMINDAKYIKYHLVDKPIEINKGMTIEEVKNILGNPSQEVIVEGILVYKYKDWKISFKDGKVIKAEFF